MGPTLSTETSPASLPKDIPKKTNKETIFILDWDDTLMCTSFLKSNTQPLSKEKQNIMLNLGHLVSEFLSHCKEYGKIIILTNSTESWVKSSAIEKLGITDLVDNNIKIISARDKYLKKEIEIKYWKEIALEEMFNKFEINKIGNLIFASDSERDINTFKKFKQKNKSINISTIKFKRKPSPLILIKEIKYLRDCISKIIGTNKNYFLFKEEKENTQEEFIFHFGNFFDYIFYN